MSYLDDKDIKSIVNAISCLDKNDMKNINNIIEHMTISEQDTFLHRVRTLHQIANRQYTARFTNLDTLG